MDFFMGLPKSKGFEVILVVIDMLSKYGHFLLLKHPYTAYSVAEIFARNVIKLHGVTKTIVSDRDAVFMSLIWSDLFRLQGTHLKMSTAYNPETDGQSEALNKCVETYLRCFCSEQPKGWSHWVHWVEYWYNTSYQTTAGMTPFEVVYGKRPPTVIKFLPRETKYKGIPETGSKVLRTLSSIKESRTSGISFETTRGVQDTSSVSCVMSKESGGTGPDEVKLPREVVTDLFLTFEPEEVLAERTKHKKGNSNQQILVRWKGRTSEEATWEDKEDFKAQFPEFRLEDKAILEEAGHVMDPNTLGPVTCKIASPTAEETNKCRPKIVNVYVRKGKGKARERNV
ncbi:uncharacterized protein [Primulina eburnea]|uniref:uncharacterized protein n=1 Tax=Primulina eburnea TaxID=1245227 RepID=UPI003C6C8057